MKRVKTWLGQHWRVLIGVTAGLLFVSFLYTFHLQSLTHGLSPVESTYATNNSYLRHISEQPVFLPHKLLTMGARAINDSGWMARLPSVLLAVLNIGCFFVLVSRWYTRRIALLATLLFATSSWTLTIGRQALPTVTYLGWLPILALMYWTIAKGKHTLGLLLWGLSAGLALYVPGLLWFVAVLAASQLKRLKALVTQAAAWQLISSISLFVILAVPYCISLFRAPTTALESLGIPVSMAQVTDFPDRLLHIFLQIFIYAGSNPLFHLGHLPYLDIVSVVLFGVGIYRLRYSSARKMMAWSGVVTIGWLIGAGFGAINIAVFLPLVYMFIGGGLSFLLVQWLKVFPRNPIARTFGFAVITVLVLLVSAYHLTRYFIAWPMNPATKSSISGKIDR